jgi:hypothetical protein
MNFSERSAERFAKTCDVIRELFKNHPEETEETIQLAKSLLVSARAEAVAKAASATELSSEFSDVFAVPHDGAVLRHEPSREDRVGNIWAPGAAEAFEKSLRAANAHKSESFDSSWYEPVGGVQKSTDAPLAKGELVSRLYSFLEKLRPHCINDEAEQLEKAVRCSDVALFAQIGEGILSRVAA